MTKKLLLIGAATGSFTNKKGQRFVIVKDKPYAFTAAAIKGHEEMFYTADQYIEKIEAKSFSRPVVETATANPGDTREVTAPKKSATPKKPAAEK